MFVFSQLFVGAVKETLEKDNCCYSCFGILNHEASAVLDISRHSSYIITKWAADDSPKSFCWESKP